MAISITDRKVTYAGNGATTVWPLTFPVLEAAHVGVILTDATGVETTLASGFTVATNLTSVVYPTDGTKLAAGNKITLVRTVPYTQESDLGEQWPFKTIEDMSDRSTMQIQQLAEELARCVKTSITSEVAPDQLLAEIRTGAATATASATAAATSEMNAAASASTASTAATTATGAASTASTAATTATGAASTANTKAAEAVLSADAAGTSASTATTKATEASTSANTASTQAGIATTQAEAATTKATEAASSAAAAAVSANIATVNAGYLALPNHVVKGGKVASVSGLTMTHDFIEALINRKKTYKAAGDTQTFPAKRKGLFTIDKDGNRGALLNASPIDFVDNYTIGFWELDGSASIPNQAYGKSSIAVVNPLVRAGTLGSTIPGLYGKDVVKGGGGIGNGYNTSNSTNAPTGNADFCWEFSYTAGAIGTYQGIIWLGTTSAKAGFQVGVNAAGNVVVFDMSTVVDTGFTMTVGAEYEFAVGLYSGTVAVYVNGVCIYAGLVGTWSLTGTLAILREINSSYPGSVGAIHYLEYRKQWRTLPEIAEKAAKLLFPVCWNDAAGKRKNLASLLSSGVVALGMFRTTASAISYNDADWQWARREGASGGNRRVLLTPTIFSGSITFALTHPFGTGVRYADKVLWWSDAVGSIQLPALEFYFSGTTPFGVQRQGSFGKVQYATGAGSGGVAYHAGSFKTSGYLVPVVEVLEQEEEVPDIA